MLLGADLSVPPACIIRCLTQTNVFKIQNHYSIQETMETGGVAVLGSALENLTGIRHGWTTPLETH